MIRSLPSIDTTLPTLSREVRLATTCVDSSELRKQVIAEEFRIAHLDQRVVDLAIEQLPHAAAAHVGQACRSPSAHAACRRDRRD